MKSNRYRPRSLFAPTLRPKPPRKKWRVFYVLKAALKRTCMVVGAFVLFGAFMGMLLSSVASREVAAPMLPDKMVLYLSLENSMIEHENQLGPYDFGDNSLAIRNAVWALDHAAKDDRVKGFVLQHKGGAMSLSHTEELRAAIERFRASGKPTYIYATSYGGIGSYYLASAFEHIWLQPMGLVSIAGINAEMPYARDLLDKIGVKPQVFARKDYKNLFENATDSEMSAESREALQAVIDDYKATMSQGIANHRTFDQAKLQQLVDTGLFTDVEAKASGLIDNLEYIDSFNDEIHTLVTGKPDSDEKIFVFMKRYLKDTANARQSGGGLSKKPKVGLVYVVGGITSYDDGGNSLGAADKLVKVINNAADDDTIGTLVIRVDSPGGDPTAAEAIRHAIVKAKEKGKKIVVSMGSNAASGGYWVSANADYIFALPTTLTGSIGVAGGKFTLGDMWDKIGVNWDGVSWGQNAGMWSVNEPYSETQRARMDAMMDRVYDEFITIVAEGRKMDKKDADAVSGGRVWTGLSAKRVGLVDELGGLDTALDYAATLEGAKSREDINLVVLPRPKSTFEKVIEFVEMQTSMGYFFHTNRDLFSLVTKTWQDVKSSAMNGLVLQK